MTNKWSLFDLFLRFLLQHVIQSNHGHHTELSDTDQHMIILNVNCPQKMFSVVYKSTEKW